MLNCDDAAFTNQKKVNEPDSVSKVVLELYYKLRTHSQDYILHINLLLAL